MRVISVAANGYDDFNYAVGLAQTYEASIETYQARISALYFMSAFESYRPFSSARGQWNDFEQRFVDSAMQAYKTYTCEDELSSSIALRIALLKTIRGHATRGVQTKASYALLLPRRDGRVEEFLNINISVFQRRGGVNGLTRQEIQKKQANKLLSISPDLQGLFYFDEVWNAFELLNPQGLPPKSALDDHAAPADKARANLDAFLKMINAVGQAA